MGVGPNYVLDKGLLATGTTAYSIGDVLEMIAGSGSMSGVLNAVQRCGTATSLKPLAVCQEPLDTVRLGYGKAFIDCRLMGIARVKAGSGGVTAGDRVKPDATAGATTVTRAIAGAQPVPILGVALTTASAAGLFDCLLTPGASY